MFDYNRPKLKLKKSILDIIIEYFTLALLIFSILFSLYHYQNLPDKIPMHFNFEGKVDSYSSKTSIWALHMFTILTVMGLFYLNRFPHVFNYLNEITIENAKKNYTVATRMIRYLNCCIALLFTIISYKIITIAILEENYFNPFENILFNSTMFGIFIIPILGIIVMYKKQ
ncbi:MAG: DUF1648 domain-containing protein [Oceanihabitans sp.]